MRLGSDVAVVPFVLAEMPVERPAPALGADVRPSVGEPQLGAPVAAVAHEGQVLAGRDQPGSQGVGRRRT